MKQKRNSFIQHFTQMPKQLFLVDAIGAMVTACLLFFVLKPLENFFGMPTSILNFLAMIALCFCLYSTAFFLFLPKHYKIFLTIISLSNLGYCMLTCYLVVTHIAQLTNMGILYFLGEIVVVCLLAYTELKVAKNEK